MKFLLSTPRLASIFLVADFPPNILPLSPHAPRPGYHLIIGAALGPLARFHPEDAEDLRVQAVRRLGAGPVCSTDSRCAGYLRGGGLQVQDPVSHLLSLVSQ